MKNKINGMLSFNDETLTGLSKDELKKIGGGTNTTTAAQIGYMIGYWVGSLFGSK